MSKTLKTILRITVLVVVSLVLGVNVYLWNAESLTGNALPMPFGYGAALVLTGSMEPTIPVGSLLVTRQVDITSIQLDDIICFRTQESAIWGSIVTHRVVEVFDGGDSGVLLRTQGDANLVADGYFVDYRNFVGKVIWHTGDDSILAAIFAFFTNKVGFLGCIVFPCLLFAGLILRECVGNIRLELQNALEELEKQEEEDWDPSDPLCSMTQEEYDEMYQRIRAELMEELMEELRLCGEIFENL